MKPWLSRLLNSTWAIPTSVLALGGFWVASLEEADKEIRTIENDIQITRRDILSDQVQRLNNEWRLKQVNTTDNGQAPQLVLYRENLYPQGNPPYKDLVGQKKKKKIKRSATANLDKKLKDELAALKLVRQKRKVNLPRSLDNPVKKRKAIKMLADTYKIFNRDIDVATEVVQDAIDNNSRTEDEINEALEAINQMKKGRRMLIEKIQIIEEASEDDDDGDTDDFVNDDEEN